MVLWRSSFAPPGPLSDPPRLSFWLQTGRNTDRQTDRQIDRDKAETETDKQTGKQRSRQADRLGGLDAWLPGC